MRQKSQCPCHRIGKIQRFHGMELGQSEKCKNPKQTQTAGTYQRYQHRYDGMPQSTQGAYYGIHHAAQSVQGTNNTKSHHTRTHHSRIWRIKCQQLSSEKIYGISQ